MTLKQHLIKIIPLMIVVCGLLTYSFMQAQWVGPEDNPPKLNTPAPINMGSSTQAKTGNFMANIVAAATSTWSPKYCDATGGNCFTATSIGGGIGVNQTWQNFTGLRAANVWYRNTTNSPISVYVWVSPGDGFLYANTVNSDTGAVQIAGPDNSSGTRDNLFGIIPAGHWYKQTGRNPTGWSELR